MKEKGNPRFLQSQCEFRVNTCFWRKKRFEQMLVNADNLLRGLNTILFDRVKVGRFHEIEFWNFHMEGVFVVCVRNDEKDMNFLFYWQSQMGGNFLLYYWLMSAWYIGHVMNRKGGKWFLSHRLWGNVVLSGEAAMWYSGWHVAQHYSKTAWSSCVIFRTRMASEMNKDRWSRSG